MINEHITKIEKIFIGKKIEKISFQRGLGIVPAWFTITLIDENKKKLNLEIEANFRILGLTENILSFEDLFLDHSMHEISRRKYQSQKAIEKTYLEKTLLRANQIFDKRKIRWAKFYPYGDLELKCYKAGKIHIINDTHECDASLFRLIHIEDKNVLFEIKLVNGIPQLIEAKHS